MDYKLIHFDYGKTEFYNLKNDPLETKNLSYFSMSADEGNNYNYLCEQYTQLTNTSAGCTVTGINEIVKNLAVNIYPNPFSKHIQIENIKANTFVELYNSIGEKIYAGTQIELQDFSNLATGIYFIKLENQSIAIIKE